MRVLELCTNFWPGGIQRHVLDLTEYLREHGHNVTLAGDEGAWSGDVPDADYVHLSLNQVAAKGASLPVRVMTLMRMAWKLRRVLKDRKIELIHAHETAPALVAHLATRGLRIPVAMTFHGAEPSRVPSVAKTAIRCADLTISPSHTTLQALIDRGVPRDKARQIGLGIKPMPEVPEADITELRRALLPNPDGMMIFSLSRLDRQKGIDYMIEVAKRILPDHPDTVFVVAGGGPLDGEVQRWAEDAGVAANMRFLGPIRTVPQHLAAADLFLLTSRWEALPISIVEAFRAGLPVIATDCGGVKELVDDTVGALCDVGDVEALTAAVRRMIEDPDHRKARGAAALALSHEDRFSPDHIHGLFESAYKGLIEAAR